MPLQIINDDTVKKYLPMAACIDLMAETMVKIFSKQTRIPQRTFVPLPAETGVFAIMPGTSTNPALFGAKLVSYIPENVAADIPAIQGVIVLFEATHGRAVAVVDAIAVTAVRTAAASGMATRALARQNAQTLVLLGYGAQASYHLDAMLAVRPIERVIVWGRSLDKAGAFAAKHGKRVKLPIEASADVRGAVEQADIICTVTSSPKPILKGAWIAPGTHLNLVGAFTPTTREVDTECILRASLFVEIREFALQEAGEIIIPLNAGYIDEKHIKGEIAQVITREIDGRKDAHDITCYKSLGNTAQDIAAAYHVYQQIVNSKPG